MEFKWDCISEDILDNVASTTHRAKVFGGWIVKYDTWLIPESVSTSTVFIPDKDHKWRVDL